MELGALENDEHEDTKWDHIGGSMETRVVENSYCTISSRGYIYRPWNLGLIHTRLMDVGWQGQLVAHLILRQRTTKSQRILVAHKF